MKNAKRVIALLLALVLSLTPVSTVYATGSDDTATPPSSGEEGSINEGDGSSGSEDDSTPESTIEISFDYDAEPSESGWYSDSKDLTVVFPNTVEFAEVKLSYVKGTDESKEVTVDSEEDGTYKSVISGLSDGEYVYTAYAKDIDGVEYTETFELKLDTAGVDYSAISAEGLSILEGIGYAKDAYVLNGFKDSTSGIKSIATKGADGVINEYTTGDGVSITPEVTSLVLVDIAGNETEISVNELIAGLCSEVVFDSVVPAISITRESEASYDDGSQKYYNDKLTLKVTVSDDNLKEVVVYVNEEWLGTSTILGKKVTLAYSFEESGDYVIDVIVKDKTGNEVTKTESFTIDKDAPEIGSISVNGTYAEHNEKLYTTSTMSITGAAVDALSGYSRVEVVKDSEVVGTSLPYTITVSGEYIVKVYDNVCNCSEFTLASIAGASSSEVVVDDNLPAVSVGSISDVDYSGVNGYWYSTNPVIGVSASDDNLKSVTVTLKVDGTPHEMYSGSEGISNFEVGTTQYEGTSFSVEVSAEDLSGNTDSATYEFYVDKTPPHSVTATADSPSAEKGGNVYYNDTFSVKISAQDDGFGDLTYYLDDKSNKTGEFSGVGAGEHTIRVEDGLGNTIEEQPLSNYLGWDGNNVVIVSDKPVIESNSYNGNWVGTVPNYDIVISDASGIDSYKVEVNNVIVKEDSFDGLDSITVSVPFDLSGLEADENSSYSVKITAINNSGLSNVWTDVVKVDTNAPEIGSIVVDGEWVEAAGKIFSGGSLTITGEAVDTESGVASITVFNGEEVVARSLPYAIQGNGSYKVVIVDNVNNSSEFLVAQIIGSSSNDIVIDTSSPIITRTDKEEETVTGWYNYVPVLRFSVTDECIKYYSVTVNNDVVKEGSSSEEFELDLSKYTNTAVSVTVYAEDVVGHSEEFTYNYSHDSNPPYDVTVSTDSSVVEKGGNVYFSDKFLFTVLSTDDGYGDISYYVGNESNKTGKFEITTDGEYTLVVKDGLGNTVSEKTLAEYLGWSGNNIVFVSDKPVISATGFEGKWVGSIPSYNITAEDEAGINLYKVTVNGVTVAEKSFDELNKTSVGISFDLSGITIAEDGIENVSVYVENNAGLSSVWTDVVKVDTHAPEIGEITAEGEWNEVDDKVYSKSTISISGDATDAHSGVATVVVMNGNTEVSNSLPYHVSVSGNYKIIIIDQVGNYSSYDLNELLGTTSNDVVIDSEVPSLGFDASTTAPDAVVNGVNWFKEKPIITVSASDNHRVDVTVIVKADGNTHIDYDESVSEALSYDIDISKYEGSSFDVSVSAVDDSGNEYFISYSFSVDSEKPSEGSLKIKADYEDTTNGAFTNNSFTFSGTAADDGSGIDSLVIYKESERCYESLDGSVDFTLDDMSESGLYTIVVTDKVGNQSTFHAKDLLGSQSSVLVIDKNKPVITRTDTESEISSGWYNYAPELKFNVTDEYLKSYTASVNGGVVKEGISNGEISLDMSNYLDMLVSVEIVAEDEAGNTSTYTYEYSHDGTAPNNISASSTTPYTEKTGFVYFTNDLVISVKADDAGYGNLTYYLNEESNKTGNFTINTNGEYFIKVVDGMGNESESIALKDLLGWQSNSVVFDSGKPTVTAYKYAGQWVAKAPVYSFGFSDNYGIDSITISVNTSELVNKTYDVVDATNESLSVNLADATVNKDGSYLVKVVIVDNSGLSSVWEDTVYLDNTAPSVNNFEIGGATNSIGATINGKDTYGFFFDGNGTVTVVAVDDGASSGIANIWTRFEGEEWIKHTPDSNGKFTVSVPENFKGKFEAYVVDKVGNVGEVNCPDLFVSETEDAHDKSSEVTITLPDTPYTDVNGLPLYNNDITVNVVAGCETSGVSGMEWGIGELTDTISNLNGTSNYKNLITAISQGLGIVGNENGMEVIVKVTDMVGHTIEGSKFFSIDMDKPLIEVTFDTTTDNGHYNVTRTATIKVAERNFNSDLFVVSGVYGKLGTWSNDGDVWTNTITFADNNEYSFTLDCTDRAGNAATQYVSEGFVVDKTSPVIERIDTNVESAAGWYKYTPELKFNVAESYISYYEVYINGSKVANGNGAEIIVPTSKYTNMAVNVRVYVEDKAGNSDEFTYSYNHDNLSPVNVAVSAETPVTQKGGTVYFNGQFDISVSAEDGIGYGDLTYYLNDESNKTGKFTISESGEYSIKVVDGLGHVYGSVELGTLCGWEGNKVVINNFAPTIKFNKHNGAWLDGTCIYDVTVGSVVGVDSVVVIVNGTEVVNSKYSGIDTIEDLIKVDISKAVMAEDSSYSTKIIVTDNSGLVTTSKDIVYVDLKAPEMGNMGVEGSWEIHGSYLYTKGVITLNGYPVDPESGIKSVEVLKDGNPVGTLPYNILESGKYEVRVTDNVGNQIVYSFAEIAQVSTSNVVWDDTLPSVYFDMEKSDKHQYADGETYWYAKNPTIYIGMTDTNMESVSVSVTIDGTRTVVVDDIIENGIYAINTSYAMGTEFEVVATARDKSGNISEATYEFRVDSSKPSKGTFQVTATPEWLEVDGYVYIRGQFSITGAPADIGSGIKRITVYKDGEVFASLVNGELNIVANLENLSGSYSVEVEDNVGNIYSVNANELLGTVSNDFIIDLTDPTIVRTDENVETKTGWFNYDPVFTFDINDTYISEYTVYVNNDLVKTGTKSESISIDTSNYKNQSVTIKINVVDKAGNTAEYVYNYQEDSTCPENVKIEMASPVTSKGDNVYYNGTIDLVISATDNAYGDISYYINGTRVDEGKYTISQSGEYNFEVVDGLGNTTGVISLKDFFNWSGNNIVIDGSNPVIESNKYEGSWIKGIGSYSINVSDNIGIDSIVATVNGVKVVDIKTTVTTDVEEVIKIDTTMVETNDDGSYKTVVTVVDNAGLVTTWEDIVYVDNIFPVVDSFTVHGDVNRLDTNDAYGYFFSGNGTVEILCTDANPSSGIESIWTRLEGYDWVEHKANESGVITVSIPADFKGMLEAYAVDKVGNIGTVKSPAKLISESAENHAKNQTLEITLPETPYRDANGLPLYNADAVADLVIGCDWSGLQKMTWGIDGVTEVTDFSSGVFEENIITKYSQKLPLTGNANNLTMSVAVTDWTNHMFSKDVNFSIDKDVPTINVVFNSTVDNGCYKDTRIATITVNERNFNPELFVIGGNSGTLGSWTNEGNIWTNTITFSADGDYKFTLDCTDRAGNVATQYVSEEFTIDKTAPVMTVTWNNNSFENEMYYKEGRTATVTVVEHNFDSSLFTLTGNGSLSGWSTTGDTHTATVRFDDNGEYEFSINGFDLANNSISEVYNSGKFVIDLTAPIIEFSRISDGVSYKNDVEFVVTVSDTYINGNTKVYLSGKLHDEVEISGQFVGQTGTFSYTNFPEEADIDDIYTIRVVAVDNAGNVTEDTLMFSVNRFGSSYSFYDAEYLNNYLNEPKDISISEVNVDKLDIDKIVVTITKDGKEIEVKENWVSISEEEVDNKFLYTYSVSKEAFTEDGKYSVTIMSEAEEGTKYTSASERYSFIIDQTAPVVIISGIENGEDYHEYERNVAIDLRDLSGIASIKIIVNGEEIDDYTESDGIYHFTVGESQDSQAVRVEVVDMAGNTTVSEVSNFLITSNLMVYLINQLWFLILIAVVLFLIILMIILLLLNRRKDKDDEQEALAASGELYRSSTAGSSSSGTTGNTSGNENQILSGEAPTLDQGAVVVDNADTSVMEDSADTTPTGIMDEEATGVLEENSDDDTGVLD